MICLHIFWVGHQDEFGVSCLMNEKLWERTELSSEVPVISLFLLGECVYFLPLVFILVNVLQQINLLPASIFQLVLFGADKWLEFDTVYQLSPCWVLPTTCSEDYREKSELSAIFCC